MLALITGASSGIGYHLAHEHAARGGDCVLVARRKAELDDLASELTATYNVRCDVVALDLTAPGAVAKLVKKVEKIGRVDVLINNAGYGGHGTFLERGPDHAMVDLNIKALTELCHAFVPGMMEKGGHVLNVGSIAGFLPGPLQATYYATKAFVNSFSQALAEELRRTRVTVTVLCPGPVVTGFQDAAEMPDVKAFKMPARAEDVARYGYKMMEKGKRVAIHKFSNRFAVWLMRFVPRSFLVKVSRKSMEV